MNEFVIQLLKKLPKIEMTLIFINIAMFFASNVIISTIIKSNKMGIPNKTIYMSIVFITTITIYIAIKISKRKKLAFGVLWDKHNHPYCYKCKNPLIIDMRPDTDRLCCSKCETTIRLYDLENDCNLIHIKEAIKIIRPPNPRSTLTRSGQVS